jgi:hypothetical protein
MTPPWTRDSGFGWGAQMQQQELGADDDDDGSGLVRTATAKARRDFSKDNIRDIVGRDDLNMVEKVAAIVEGQSIADGTVRQLRLGSRQWACQQQDGGWLPCKCCYFRFSTKWLHV